MNRSHIRITPLGYIVLSIIVLVMLIGIYFIIWSMRNSADEKIDAMATMSPTPSLAPIDSLITPAPTTALLDDPPSAPTSAGGITAPPGTTAPVGTSTPDPKSKVVRTPTPEESAAAQDGTLKTGGINMRAGPSQQYATTRESLGEGTKLKVFSTSGDYSYVQIVKTGEYGYIATKFISITATTARTPSPAELSGARDGVVKKRVNLREGPATSHKVLGTYDPGTVLKVYSNSGEYSFVQIVSEGKYGYMFTDYITVTTPSTSPSAGGVPGTVDVRTELALREKPDKSSGKWILSLKTGYEVTVFFKTGNYYYIQYGDKFGYALAQYILVNGGSASVPAGTPVP